MRTLYPAIKPYVRHSLAVDDVHTLYIEECGNPAGIPVLFLHGGPGGGVDPLYRRYFDPDRYRIILFDQRGSGKSTPHASLVDNTTQHLVDDIEAIRGHLGVRRWLVFGGSWGSTLALVYAQAYPEQVLGMVLRGIFLARQQDFDWLYRFGASEVFPEYWREFEQFIPQAERDDIVKAYHDRLTGEDEVKRMAAAKAWSIWEGRCATLNQRDEVLRHFADPHLALSLARIEAHYFVNDGFLDPDQILDNVDSIADIPGIIVHGRYDMVCPVSQAYELHEAWPRSDLRIVSASGHSASEPGTVDALLKATDQFAKDLA